MVETARATAVADRLERYYLALLRGLTLVIATICILGAIGFGLDGVRRALTQTDIKPEPVAVSSEEALGSILRTDAAGKDAAKAEGAQISAEDKKVYATFFSGPFEQYYQAYRKLAAGYNKPEDTILPKAKLAEQLGYTVEILGEPDPIAPTVGEASDPETAAAEATGRAYVSTAKLFIRDPAYAKAQVEAVIKAVSDKRLAGKAQSYKAAQKTAQACHTEYVARSVWDPNSMACRDWYLEPYGCSVRRQMPVDKCEPAYPEGIKSPLALFSQIDESYRLTWNAKTEEAGRAAQAKSDERQAIKAGASGSWMLALQIGGAFALIMFLFLLIAVERHLRRLADQRAGGAAEAIGGAA